MSADELLAYNTFRGAMACGLLALVVPWIALFFNRKAAALAAGVLALAGTILELISNSHIPSKYNIRADLVFVCPLLLIAWLECIGLGIWAAVRAQTKETP